MAKRSANTDRVTTGRWKHRCRRRPCVWLAALLLLAVAPRGNAAERTAISTWELTPYRIQVIAAVGPGLAWSSRFEPDLLADLAAQAESIVGSAWRLEAVAAPVDLRQRILDAPAEIALAEVPEAALKFDKVIVLGVAASADGYRVQARELDVTTRLWNGVVTRDVGQSINLNREAFGAVRAAFAPLARIERAGKDAATVRLRAGALKRRDAAPVAGVVFRPVLVERDADGNAKTDNIKSIAWTYLRGESADDAAVTCRLYSGLEKAIPDFHARRQRMALAIAPPRAATRLHLVSADKKSPLAGYEVLSQDSQGKATERLGLTDRQGTIAVPAGGEPLRILFIKHGEELMARLPIVPGLDEKATVPLADDDQRLAAEYVVARLRDQIIDQSTRREALAARIAAARSGRNAALAAALERQLLALPSVEAMVAAIDQQRETMKSADPALQQKIDKLFADTRSLLVKPMPAADEQPAGQPETSAAQTGDDQPAVAKPSADKPKKPPAAGDLDLN